MRATKKTAVADSESTGASTETSATPPPPTYNFVVDDPVIVTARDQKSEDEKSGLYYPHFANLRGRILKVYGQEASVLVDIDSLPAEVIARHKEHVLSERKKYWDRLSETARDKVVEKEKNFDLRYVILVGMKDLTKIEATLPEGTAEETAKRISAADLDSAEEQFLASRATN